MLILPPSRLYRPQEMQIYRYFNGKHVQRVDPLPLFRRLMDAGPALDTDLRLSTMPATYMRGRPCREAHANVLKQVRDVFNVASYEEGGLTEAETVALLSHFLSYVTALRTAYEQDSDNCRGSLGMYAVLLQRKPPYEAHVGFWLNRRRVLHMEAGAVLFGVLTALGGMDPGMAFWRTITDGEGQALTLKGQLQASRQA